MTPYRCNNWGYVVSCLTTVGAMGPGVAQNYFFDPPRGSAINYSSSGDANRLYNGVSVVSSKESFAESADSSRMRVECGLGRLYFSPLNPGKQIEEVLVFFSLKCDVACAALSSISPSKATNSISAGG